MDRLYQYSLAMWVFCHKQSSLGEVYLFGYFCHFYLVDDSTNERPYYPSPLENNVVVFTPFDLCANSTNQVCNFGNPFGKYTGFDVLSGAFWHILLFIVT